MGNRQKPQTERLVEARFVMSLVSPAKTFGLDPRGSSELAKEVTLHSGSNDYRVMGSV